MGIGGHVDTVDSSDSPLVACAERELKEEIKSDTNITIDWDNPVMVIRADDTPVDRVHIGLVLLAYVDNERTLSIYPAEEAVSNVEMLTLSQHLYEATEAGNNYEVWARRVLESGQLNYMSDVPVLVMTAIRNLNNSSPLEVTKVASTVKDDIEYTLYKAVTAATPVIKVVYAMMFLPPGSAQLSVALISRSEASSMFGEKVVEYSIYSQEL